MLAGMAPRRRRRGRGEARWLLAEYAGLTGFFALEGLLRQPGSASSLHASDDDRGTTRIIAIAYGRAIDIPLFARWLPRHPLPPAVAPAGLLVQVRGLTAMPARRTSSPASTTPAVGADGTSARESTSRPPFDPGGAQDTAARTSAATFSCTSGVHVTSASPTGQTSPSSRWAESWNSRVE